MENLQPSRATTLEQGLGRGDGCLNSLKVPPLNVPKSSCKKEVSLHIYDEQRSVLEGKREWVWLCVKSDGRGSALDRRHAERDQRMLCLALNCLETGEFSTEDSASFSIPQPNRKPEKAEERDGRKRAVSLPTGELS